MKTLLQCIALIVLLVAFAAYPKLRAEKKLPIQEQPTKKFNVNAGTEENEGPRPLPR